MSVELNEPNGESQMSHLKSQKSSYYKIERYLENQPFPVGAMTCWSSKLNYKIISEFNWMLKRSFESRVSREFTKDITFSKITVG